MKVAFRADASIEIGSGHVMRCLALADALRRRGASSRFFCRQVPGHLGERIRASGHDLTWLHADQPDAEASALALSSGNAEPYDGLVVDHYALDAGWEQHQRGMAKRILAIDDLANRPHDCDILLDQNHYENASTRYAGLLPTHCQALLGPRYALLQPAFAEARKTLRPRLGLVKRVLICFGGSDPANATALAVEGFLAAQLSGVQAEVIVGTAYPHWAALQQRYGQSIGQDAEQNAGAITQLELRQGVTTMAEAMARADVFMGAGGTMTWERAALGLPGITVALADNQRQLSLDLALAGAGLHLGDASVVQASDWAAELRELVDQPERLCAMSERLLDFTDGQGAARVAARFFPESIQLRLACGDDAQRVYAWRNHPHTRRFFTDPTPVDQTTHLKWFARSLHTLSRVLLIAERQGEDGQPEAVGVLRFDCQGEEACVSIYLDPARQGEGLGRTVLQAGLVWLAAHKPDIRCLTADILPGNVASRAVFASVGFRAVGGIDVNPAANQYKMNMNTGAGA